MYEPAGAPPEDSKALAQYLDTELRRLSEILTAGVGTVLLPTLNVAPERPREGMVVLADGTNWNPGSGAGFYGYRGGAWVLLG